jgi:predicted DsbA family dithiol-disulfide isomerase
MDLGKVETLVALGAEVGLPADELRAHLEARTYQGQVTDGLRWAHQVGVTAVPTFIFDELYGVVGAQPYDVLGRVVEEVLRRRASGEAESEG